MKLNKYLNKTKYRKKILDLCNNNGDKSYLDLDLDESIINLNDDNNCSVINDYYKNIEMIDITNDIQFDLSNNSKSKKNTNSKIKNKSNSNSNSDSDCDSDSGSYCSSKSSTK